jgi:hypothetical protein
MSGRHPLRISKSKQASWDSMLSKVLFTLGTGKYLSVPTILAHIRVHWPCLTDDKLARGSARLWHILKQDEGTRFVRSGKSWKLSTKYRVSMWRQVAPKKAKAKKKRVSKKQQSPPPQPPAGDPPPTPPYTFVPSPPSAEVAPLPAAVNWQYRDDTKGGWCDYDPPASADVEAHFAEYSRNPGRWDIRSVDSGNFKYLVDFRQMRQTNIIHKDHTERPVRRIVVRP